MVADVERRLLPDPTPFVIDLEKAEGHHIFEQGNTAEIKQVVRTNDVILLADGPREPGEELRWHTHMPDLYQIMIVVRGTLRLHWRDDDGEEYHEDVQAGEVAFWPGGVENKLETVGDEPVEWFGLEPDMSVNRVEHLLGEHLEGVYDPSAQTKALDFDSTRNIVVDMDEDAVRQGSS